MNAYAPSNQPRPFAWSFSALESYERCPKKFYHENIAKDVKRETTSAGDWGSDAHKALELRLVKQRPLPLGMGHCEGICALLERQGARIYGENKVALTRAYAPTDYFAKDVWLRGQADVVIVLGLGAVVVDWKFGRYTDSWKDQGLIMAMVHFQQMLEVQTIGVAFVWFKESGANPPISERTYTRQSIVAPWSELLGRVARMEEAVGRYDFPPRENFLCRAHCPVFTCPHNGRGASHGAGAGAGQARG